MTITDILEVKNPTDTQFKAIKERADIYVPGIKNLNISRRNGMIYVLAGAGGSGKSNLLLNLFKSKDCYRAVFDNIWYFCPAASFASIANHPFADHPRVYHELDVQTLEQIYLELVEKKVDDRPKVEKHKKRKKKSKFEDDFEESDESSDEEKNIEYSCVVFDDFADLLKCKDIQRQLNKMLIKARHLGCAFIFTLQSYLYFPKILRKQISFISLWKTRNVEEFNSIAKELLNLSKDDSIILYDYVFNAPYNHLDIDTNENKLYKNFNSLSLKG